MVSATRRSSSCTKEAGLRGLVKYPAAPSSAARRRSKGKALVDIMKILVAARSGMERIRLHKS